MAHAEDERRALGRDLAQARKDAGFTMESAAAELTRRGFPITKQTIGAWEVGRNLPDALWLRRIARLYGTTMDALSGNAARTDWPFSEELHTKVIAQSDDARARLERLMRADLDMPQQTSPSLSHARQLDVSPPPAHQYARGSEDVAGLPNDMQVPASRQHAKRATDRGRPHKKSGGGA